MTSQPDTSYPELDDPTFIKRFDAAVAVEQAEFDAWLAQDKFEELIDHALAVGRATFAASAGMAEEENPRWTLALIDLGHRRAKLIVQALQLKGVGHEEISSTYSWDIGFADILGKRKAKFAGANSAQMDATVEAFALALSKPGFELQIWRE